MPLARRMNNHRRSAGRKRRTPKERWLSAVAKAGKRPRIVVVEECSVDRSSAIERRWIRRLSSRFPLLNASLGGAGNPGVGRIVWNEQLLRMLGTIADSEIAKLIGCHRKSVSYKRECLGIPASFDRTNNTDPPSMGGWNRINFPTAIIQRLGSEPDYVIAARAGVSKRSIARARREQGIPSYAQKTGNNGRIRVGEPHRRWKV